MNITKPGYYLNTNKSIILVYPKGYNNTNDTQLEVYQRERWILLSFDNAEFNMLNLIGEFEYLGDL